MKTKYSLLALLLGSGLCLAQPAPAASLSLLHGNTYRTYPGDTVEKEILTIDHFGIWKYGTVYFFYDISYPRRKDDKAEFFGSISPTFSFSKITGQNWSYGILQDVSLKLELEHVSGVTPVYYYGLAYDLKLPYFAFAQISTVLRDDPNRPGVGGQLNGAWSIPFGSGRWFQWAFQGFWAAGIVPEGADQFFLMTQPQLLYDISPYFGTDRSSAQVGVEYSYAINRYLKKGYVTAAGTTDPGFDERVVQAMIKLNY